MGIGEFFVAAVVAIPGNAQSCPLAVFLQKPPRKKPRKNQRHSRRSFKGGRTELHADGV